MRITDWKAAFGDDDFDKIWVKAVELVQSGLPPSENHHRSKAQQEIKAKLIEQLINDPELASIFQVPIAGAHQDKFYHDNGPKGFIRLAAVAVQKSAPPAPSRNRKQQKDTPASQLINRSPSPAEITSTNVTRTSTPVEVAPESMAHSDIDAPWKIWIHRATDQGFLIGLNMDDLFGNSHPHRKDLSFAPLLDSLKGHPDLDALDFESGRLGFVYVDHRRNYPIYSDLTLKFAFEEWWANNPRPEFMLYLEDRPRQGFASRPRLPILKLEDFYSDDEED